MPVRVEVNPELLVWARERAGVDADDLARRFPKLTAWEDGDLAPTLKQLEGFAQATHTPVGFLFLREPPDEQVPIPDYRTIGGGQVTRPSANLLDTIFQCQQRQEWYREFAQTEGEGRVPLVGSMSTATAVTDAAAAMRESLGFEVEDRGPTWTDALRLLIERGESQGVL
jgi:hypothetical protein